MTVENISINNDLSQRIAPALVDVADWRTREKDETQRVLFEAWSSATASHSDGAIVIVIKDKSPTQIKLAGTLKNNELALMYLQRLSMTLAIDFGGPLG